MREEIIEKHHHKNHQQESLHSKQKKKKKRSFVFYFRIYCMPLSLKDPMSFSVFVQQQRHHACHSLILSRFPTNFPYNMSITSITQSNWCPNLGRIIHNPGQLLDLHSMYNVHTKKIAHHSLGQSFSIHVCIRNGLRCPAHMQNATNE